MVKIYGIKNCDKVRAAVKWLSLNNIAFDNIDIREHFPEDKILVNWIDFFSLSNLVNKRSTTWKNLTTQEQENLSELNAVEYFHRYPTLIKRPVLVVHDQPRLLGFNENNYQEIFAEN